MKTPMQAGHWLKSSLKVIISNQPVPSCHLALNVNEKQMILEENAKNHWEITLEETLIIGIIRGKNNH